VAIVRTPDTRLSTIEDDLGDALFERVQRIIDAHSGSGAHQRQHPHYLKGLVWCGRCKHRYTIMPERGNGGE
jgi:hypothetical protein